LEGVIVVQASRLPFFACETPAPQPAKGAASPTYLSMGTVPKQKKRRYGSFLGGLEKRAAGFIPAHRLKQWSNNAPG
jgi:hypothetical protein